MNEKEFNDSFFGLKKVSSISTDTRPSLNLTSGSENEKEIKYWLEDKDNSLYSFKIKEVRDSYAKELSQQVLRIFETETILKWSGEISKYKIIKECQQ